MAVANCRLTEIQIGRGQYLSQKYCHEVNRVGLTRSQVHSV